jgi:hypothetical protein
VRAVAGVERGELPERGVGDEGGVAPAIALFGRVELGAGVRTFAAHDDPAPGGVAGQCAGGKDASELGSCGTVAVSAVGVDRVGPHRGGQRCDRDAFALGDGPADGGAAAHPVFG